MERKKQPLNKNDLSDVSEATLLNSFISGDDNAFTCIYRKYIDEIFAYGMGFDFDRDTLKDAIQDVFYKFYSERERLNKVTHLKYYLFRMLRNRLFDFYRHTIEKDEISHYEMSFSVKSTILDELIGQEEKLLVQAHVDELMHRLTDRQREAIYLRFIEEMEYEKIGELLDMTPGAVRKLISRAIQRMRE